MRRATKRCSTPGCNNVSTPAGYCAETCNRKHEAGLRRTTPTKRARTSQVRRHRAATVQRHVDEHDGMGHCPGYQREPHVVFPNEMTADDPVPISRGGDPMQPLTPMCRSCNSRKAGT